MIPGTLYFGDPGRESFACLHPVATAADIGLVICSSFGREDLDAYRSLRHLASMSAQRGTPALRFDYPGTGDSAGDELEPGLIARWIQSVNDAIDVLKAETGVTRVHVFGMRMGALMAALAIRERTDVLSWIGMAPVISGKSFVRELRVAGMNQGSGDAGPGSDMLLESCGFALPADAQAALSGLSLQGYRAPAGCSLLVVDRNDRPAARDGWLAEAQAAGNRISRMVMEGWEDMMAPAYRSKVPVATLERVVAWMDEEVRAVPGRILPVATGSVAPRVCHALELAGAHQRPVREEVRELDASIRLRGVLTRPADAAEGQAREGVLLLPPGADRGFGPGRMYVGLARRLAEQGQWVLRLETSGCGNSPARPGCAENAVYTPEALADVRIAIRHLRTECGIARPRVIGHCSGAYYALRVALLDTDLDSIVLINPLTFFWHDGMQIEDPTTAPILAAAAMNYRQNVFSPKHWAGILRRPSKVLNVINLVVRWQLTRARDGLRELARLLGLRLRDDLGLELSTLAKAGVTCRFIFSTGDPGETLLQSQAGRIVGQLLQAGKLTISRVPGADHMLSLRRHRVEVLARLQDMARGGSS